MSQTNHHTQLPFKKSHAFVIGINNYEHVSPLNTAVNDAQGIAQHLEEQHGFTVHPPLLNANQADLRAFLTQTIPQLVGPEDRVLFYFAGHGIALDSEEGPNGYLVPADARPGEPDSLIAMEEFHQMLNVLPCRHGLLILDCCFAGAFKWSSGFRDVVFQVPGVIYEERFWRYIKDPAWQVITSAAYDQQAVDVLSNRSLGMRGEKDGRHSPFAQALFAALAGEGDVIPQGAGDGVITATELYLYLRDQVESKTTAQAQRQTPSLFNLSRHDKGEFIFLHPRHRLNLPPAPDRNPFKGLSSFDERDASLFYGRERVVAALREKVDQTPLLVVSGASGTGKSSVIKAGLLPQLRREGWQVLPVIRPGKEPTVTLDTELPDADKQFLENGKTVLVIDQYEELITQCLDPAQGQAFEQQLAAWLRTGRELCVILSIRSDFEPQFESSPLAPWWQRGRYIVPAFSLDELREVIIRPANQEVLFYEPEDLVDQLVEEVNQAPGALPLLSFTLSELYEAYLQSGRQDRALLAADYQQLGGVIGALRTKADEVYNRQDEPHQNSMRKLMLRTASLEGGELAGKRVYEEELQFSDTAETKRTAAVAHQLVEARLVQRGVDARGKVFVEPAHDALVRAWARLWEWVKATGEEKLSLQNKLSQAVKDYEDLIQAEPKKARRLLWNNNPRLDLLNAELKDKSHGLNAREEAFVRASVKRLAARRRQLIGSLIVALVIFAGLALLANQQRITARNAQELAEKNAGIARDSTQAAKDQRQIALIKTQEARNSARVSQQQRYLADSSALVAIQERQRAEIEQRRAVQEALNARLKNYMAESRLYEEQDPLRAFRLAETGYQMTKTSGMDVRDFSDQLIKVIYSRKLLPVDDPVSHQVDNTTKTGAASRHTVRVVDDKLLEIDHKGDLIYEYPLDPFLSRITPPESCFIADNGKFVVVEMPPEGGEVGGNIFMLFQREGGLLFEVNARHYAASFFDCPFLSDQEGRTLVVLDDDYRLTVFKVSGGTPGAGYELDGFGSKTSAMSLSPSGRFLAVASEDSRVKFFELSYSDGLPAHALLSDFTAHQNDFITKLRFCDQEQVLATVAEAETKYWPLLRSVSFKVAHNWIVPEMITDPVIGRAVRFRERRDSFPPYVLNNKGLYNGEEEVLIWLDLPNSDNDPFIGFFSDDGRYLYANGAIYPIDPELILARVNEQQVLGILPAVDLDY